MEFEKIWSDLNVGEVSSKLKPLIKKIYDSLRRNPPSLKQIKKDLMELLFFLSSPEGRTDTNCRITDLFFCLTEKNALRWNHLPSDFQEIFDDISGTLHDTVSSPEIAKNFDSTPEQLLNRVKNIIIE